MGSISIPQEMIFFCNQEFTACSGYETDKFETFTKLLNAVDNATSDEETTDCFEGNVISL